MAYLLGMMVVDLFPASLHDWAVAGHILVIAWFIWLLRQAYPPLGRPYVVIALIVGTFAAWMWVAGQHWLEGIHVGGQSLGGRLGMGTSSPFITLTPQKINDVRAGFESQWAFGLHVFMKITRAVTVVPIVEELFWRGFILRAFVSWDRFEEVPHGKFTWIAFLGSSLLSIVQHPANWGVSIACWMLFNGLFYWKKSLLCCMITHAMTNLVLYLYVVKTGDWQFW